MTTSGEDNPYSPPETAYPRIAGGEVLYGVMPSVGVMPEYSFIAFGALPTIESYNIATLRMERLGGFNAADRRLQQSLFSYLGSVVAAAGQIEAEMKRIILEHAKGSKLSFAELPGQWQELEKLVGKAAADDTYPKARALREVLEWGLEHNVKETRHRAIHSEWRLCDVGRYEASRFENKSEGSTVPRDGQSLQESLSNIWQYAGKLQRVADWPTALLLPLPEDAKLVEPFPFSTGYVDDSASAWGLVRVDSSGDLVGEVPPDQARHSEGGAEHPAVPDSGQG